MTRSRADLHVITDRRLEVVRHQHLFQLADREQFGMTPSDAAEPGLAAGEVAEWLRGAVARTTSTQDSLRAALEMAVRSGLGDAASITTISSGKGKGLRPLVVCGDRALPVDQLQHDLNEGPALDAARTDTVIEVPDVAVDRRWPRWAPTAAQLGTGGSLSIHLFTDTALGSLNLYSTRPREYSCTDIATARVIAAHTSVLLAHARTVQNLMRSIDSRTVIGQAQGMLMARYGLTADAAFAVLRRYSQNRNIKLALLAEELVATGQLHDSNPHHHADQQHVLEHPAAANEVATTQECPDTNRRQRNRPPQQAAGAAPRGSVVPSATSRKIIQYPRSD